MDLACELVKLPWIYRKALLVLTQLEVMPRDCLGLLLGLHWDCHQRLKPFGVQVEDTDEHIKTTIKAGGLMDVVCPCLSCEQTILQHASHDMELKMVAALL